MNKKAVEWLYSELPGLVEKGILSPDSAERLKTHYHLSEKTGSAKTLLLIFGIIGALLVGLGIILILAHNWPQFSRPERLLIAVSLLGAAQLATGMTLYFKQDSRVWREASGVLQMLMLGASIALVGQTYHLTEDSDMFLRTWMLLSLPLIYLLKSTCVAALTIIGITAWAAGGYFYWEAQLPWLLLLLGLALPYCFNLLKQARYANTTLLLTWILNLCFYFCFFAVFAPYVNTLVLLIYSTLFTMNFLLGALWFNDGQERWQTPFQIIGVTCSSILLFILTFQYSWRNISWNITEMTTAEGLLAAILLLLSLTGAALLRQRTQSRRLLLLAAAPPIVAAAYGLGYYDTSGLASMLLLNAYVLFLSVMLINTGVRKNSLAAVNAGMLALGTLIAARFFDVNFSFVIRGLVFMSLGLAFLLTNLLIVRRRKSEGSP